MPSATNSFNVGDIVAADRVNDLNWAVRGRVVDEDTLMVVKEVFTAALSHYAPTVVVAEFLDKPDGTFYIPASYLRPAPKQDRNHDVKDE